MTKWNIVLMKIMNTVIKSKINHVFVIQINGNLECLIYSLRLLRPIKTLWKINLVMRLLKQV